MRRGTKKLISIIILAVLITGLAAMHVSASPEGGTGSGQSGDGNLVITVVGDIPAADIEDNAVPRAAPSRNGFSGTGMILMAAALAIILFFLIRMIIKRTRLKRIFSPYIDEIENNSRQ